MEEEKKGNAGGGKKNGSNGGAKRGKNTRGGIDSSVLKEKEGDDYDDANSWDKLDLYVGVKEGAEWENNERDKGDRYNNGEEIEE